MQALARAAERPARAVPAAAAPAASMRRLAPASYRTEGGSSPSSDLNSPTPPPPGSRVEPWLANPFDALVFAPRAALGALLTLPERLGGLPSDLQRAQELLLSDPRPLGDKQAIVAAEVEARLVAALEAGARAEQGALATVKSALPPDAARAVDELLPRPPLATTTGARYNNNNNSGSSYNPDWMTSTEENESSSSSSPRPPPSRYEQMYGGAAATARRAPPAVTYTADAALASRQIAAELSGVRQAVSGLKAALEAMRGGGGGEGEGGSAGGPGVSAAAAGDAGARAGVLRLNVREARDVLAARLSEVGGPPPVGAQVEAVATLNAAVREARMLLNEVDGQFGF